MLVDGRRQAAQESDFLAGKTQNTGPELLETSFALRAGILI